ncbi:hypothetical protein B0H34DRAFT_795764 [Crassisporium funariophilum]|nr:hypothetical protein B0H34DRAFT_795764 [Crassisporium funariophilum]
MQLESDDGLDRSSLNFHPDFCSEDGNVILAAKDAKVYFRVHAFTLKTTSGFFRTMYSLPQPTPSQSDIIYLDEDAEILGHLLNMICGLAFPDITSHDVLEAILYAAEKYDMPCPMALIRMYLLTPCSLEDPIRLYAVACRHGWERESRLLSSRTLVLNIYDPEYRSSLRTLSTDALLNLFVLHRSRKDSFRDSMNKPPFVHGGPASSRVRPRKGAGAVKSDRLGWVSTADAERGRNEPLGGWVRSRCSLQHGW